jgi:hypothetical protein
MQYDGLFYTRAELLTKKKKASPVISKEIENGEVSNASMAELRRRPSTGSGTSITRRPSTGSGAGITRHSSSDDLSSKGHGVQVDSLRVTNTMTAMKPMTFESSRSCPDLSSHSTPAPAPASWQKRLVNWQKRVEALGKKIDVCRQSSKDRLQRRLSHFNGLTAIKLETVCPACRHVICTSECLENLTYISALRSWIQYIIRNKKIHRSEQDCPDVNLLQSSRREAICQKSLRAGDFMTIEREKQSLQSSSDGMDLEIDSEEDETLTEKLEAKFLRKILRRRLQTRTSPYSVTAPVQYQRYGYCL